MLLAIIKNWQLSALNGVVFKVIIRVREDKHILSSLKKNY
jgi:hypothetical protein